MRECQQMSKIALFALHLINTLEILSVLGNHLKISQIVVLAKHGSRPLAEQNQRMGGEVGNAPFVSSHVLDAKPPTPSFQELNLSSQTHPEAGLFTCEQLKCSKNIAFLRYSSLACSEISDLPVLKASSLDSNTLKSRIFP